MEKFRGGCREITAGTYSQRAGLTHREGAGHSHSPSPSPGASRTLHPGENGLIQPLRPAPAPSTTPPRSAALPLHPRHRLPAKQQPAPHRRAAVTEACPSLPARRRAVKGRARGGDRWVLGTRRGAGAKAPPGGQQVPSVPQPSIHLHWGAHG